MPVIFPLNVTSGSNAPETLSLEQTTRTNAEPVRSAAEHSLDQTTRTNVDSVSAAENSQDNISHCSTSTGTDDERLAEMEYWRDIEYRDDYSDVESQVSEIDENLAATLTRLDGSDNIETPHLPGVTSSAPYRDALLNVVGNGPSPVRTIAEKLPAVIDWTNPLEYWSQSASGRLRFNYDELQEYVTYLMEDTSDDEDEVFRWQAPQHRYDILLGPEITDDLPCRVLDKWDYPVATAQQKEIQGIAWDYGAVSNTWDYMKSHWSEDLGRIVYFEETDIVTEDFPDGKIDLYAVEDLTMEVVTRRIQAMFMKVLDLNGRGSAWRTEQNFRVSNSKIDSLVINQLYTNLRERADTWVIHLNDVIRREAPEMNNMKPRPKSRKCKAKTDRQIEKEDRHHASTIANWKPHKDAKPKKARDNVKRKTRRVEDFSEDEVCYPASRDADGDTETHSMDAILNVIAGFTTINTACCLPNLPGAMSDSKFNGRVLQTSYRLLSAHRFSDYVMIINDIFAETPMLYTEAKILLGRMLGQIATSIQREPSRDASATVSPAVQKFLDDLNSEESAVGLTVSHISETVSAVINSPLGAKFIEFCGMLVGMGVIAKERLELTMYDTKIFCIPDVTPFKCTFLTATDLFLKLIERAYKTIGACLEEQSLLPLAYDDVKMKNFERAYREVKAHEPALSPGNLELLKQITLEEYAIMIEATLEVGKICLLKKMTLMVKATYEKKVQDLETLKLQCELLLIQTHGKFDPYVFNLFGPSSVGKSEVMPEIMRLILEAELGEFTASMIAEVTEEQDHDNTARTAVKGYLADDLGHLSLAARIRAACLTIMKYTGGLVKTANKASLEDKGNTLLNHILFAISSNTETFRAHKDSVCPGAIIRRVANKIDVTAMLVLCADGSTGLDKDRLGAWKTKFDFGSMGPVNTFEPYKSVVINGNDAEYRAVHITWAAYPATITCYMQQTNRVRDYKAVAQSMWPGASQDSWDQFDKMIPSFDKNKDLASPCPMDYLTFIAYMHEDSQIYYGHQRARLASKAARSGGRLFCTVCNLPTETCLCKLAERQADEGVLVEIVDDESSESTELVPFDLDGLCVVPRNSGPRTDFSYDDPYPIPREVHFDEKPVENPPFLMRDGLVVPLPKIQPKSKPKKTWVRLLKDRVRVPRITLDPKRAAEMAVTSSDSPVRAFGRFLRTTLRSGVASQAHKHMWCTMAHKWYYRETATFSAMVGLGSSLLYYSLVHEPLSAVAFGLFITGLSFFSAQKVLMESVILAIDDASCSLSDASPWAASFDFAAFGALVAAGVALYASQTKKPEKERQGTVLPQVKPFTYHVEEKPVTIASKQLEGITSTALADRVRKNLIPMSFFDDKGEKLRIHALGVHGHTYVTLKHPFEKRKVVGIQVGEEEGDRIYPFDVTQLALADGRDMAMFRFPNLGSVYDLRPYFSSKMFDGGPLRVVSTFKEIDDVIVMSGDKIAPGLKSLYPSGYFKNRTEPKKWGTCVLTYKEEKFFKKGSCGSPLISEAGNQRGIVGFHIASQVLRVPTDKKPGKELDCWEPLTQPLLNALERQLPPEIMRMSSLPDPERQAEHNNAKRNMKIGAVPGPYSPTPYLPRDCNVRVMGSCSKMRSLGSKVGDTLGTKVVRKHLGLDQEYVPPAFKRKLDGTRNYPYYEGLKSFGEANMTYVPNVHKLAELYFAPVYEALKEVEGGVLTPEELMWGTSDRKLGPLKLSTSAGFGNVSPKREHFFFDAGRWQPTNSLWKELLQNDLAIRSGKRMVHVWQATLKDEPHPAGKDKRVRMFMCPQMCYTMLCRKYFGRLLQFANLKNDLTGFAYGEDAISPQWDAMMRRIWDCPLHVEGDVSGFDRGTTSSTKKSNCEEILKWMRYVPGYTDTDVLAAEMLLADYVELYAAVDGSLVLSPNATPSGHLLTTLLNCVDNVKRLLSAFYMITGQSNFREVVQVLIHGDDFIYGTTDARMSFSNLKSACATLGVKITPPGDFKDALHPPDWTATNRLTFLSRKSVYHTSLGYCVGALDDSSLYKGILVRVRGKHVSPTEHFIAASRSFLHELFAHGELRYEREREQMRSTLQELGLEQAVPEIDESYQDRVAQLTTKWGDHTDALDTISGQIEPIYDERVTAILSDECEMYSRTPAMAVDIESTGGCPGGISGRDGLNETATRLTSFTSQQETNKTEGDGITTWFVGSNLEGGVKTPSVIDDTRRGADGGPVVLSDLLNRQILLRRIRWNPTTGPLSFNPWLGIMRDKAIQEKMRNYKLMKGMMRLKFIVNGTKFQQGRMTVSYFPRPDPDFPWHLEINNNDQGLCVQSQLLHLHLDPSSSTGGEMVLPFILPYSSLELSGNDIENMGIINMIPVVPLASTLTGPSDVGISIYAQFESLQLSVPTDSAIFSRDGEIEDTKVSSRIKQVARFAGLFKDVPYIAPYAKATEMVGNATGSALAMFGFSKPPSMHPTLTYRKTLGEGLSSAHAESSHSMIAYNPKAEVTLDPRVTGLGVAEDEMAFHSITSKDAHFARFSWDQSQQAGEALARYNVSPMLAPGALVGINSNRFALTPLAYIASLFTFWRGTITFRVQLIGSQMINGKIRIVHGPSAATDDPPYNVLRSILVDLSETRDIEFCVPWVQGSDYLRVGSLITDHPNSPAVNGNSNGQIGIYIENELACPDDDSPQVVGLVSVKSTDIEFFEPTMDEIQKYDILDARTPISQDYPPAADGDVFPVPVDDLVDAVRNAGENDDAPVALSPGAPFPRSNNVPWTFRANSNPGGVGSGAYAYGGALRLDFAGLAGASLAMRAGSSRDRPNVITRLDGTQFTVTLGGENIDLGTFDSNRGLVVFDPPGGNNNLGLTQIVSETDTAELVTYTGGNLQSLGISRNLPENFTPPEVVSDEMFLVINDDEVLVVPVGANDPLRIRSLSYYARKPGLSPSRDGMDDTQEATLTPEESCDFQTKPIPMHLHEIFYDDPVVSLRTLLKREMRTGAIYLQKGVNIDVRPMYPLFRLRPALGRPTESNLFSYITLPYIGMRGSMRWTISPVSGTARSISITRGLTGTSFALSQTFATTNNDTQGTEIFPFDSSARVAIPYYFPQRYLTPITYNQARPDLKTSVKTTVISRTAGMMDLYTSVGEDFSLIGFRACPFLYVRL